MSAYVSATPPLLNFAVAARNACRRRIVVRTMSVPCTDLPATGYLYGTLTDAKLADDEWAYEIDTHVLRIWE